jgi:hypothetical protein
MGQDDSYAWNRTTVMAGICESVANFPPAIQTPQHSCTSGPANSFALQMSLITFKLQGDSPKKHICTWGRRNQIFERHTFFGRRFGEE